MTPKSVPVSAVVVSHNRAPLIGTVLRALAFADEIIVIDKSSTDGTAQIATSFADRLIQVPWTPTVEETRPFAVAQATHDWILLLDDDECLSLEAIGYIADPGWREAADIHRLPLRHYILGRHDERAYYWPETHPRLFRRGAMDLLPTVHGGFRPLSDRIAVPAPETGICILHLSHADVWQWIEKANRYTSRPDRHRPAATRADLHRFAHDTIDTWRARARDFDPAGYPAAVSLLRATYDLVDRLKTWEEENGTRTDDPFAELRAVIESAYTGFYGVVPERAAVLEPLPAPEPPTPTSDNHQIMRAALVQAESALIAERRRADVTEAALADALAAHTDEQSRLRAELEAVYRSTSWRLTGPLRRVAAVRRDSAS